MVLCEAAAPLSIAESPVVPAATAKHPVPCPIALKFTDENVTGAWNDGKRELPIALRQVGSLNDTGSVRLDGVVEIPRVETLTRHLRTQRLGILAPQAEFTRELLRVA